MKVIVVGAGIGGLSVGISLSQAGHQVTVLESATQLAEVGAGVQMTPNAIKYFFQWGLREDLLAKAALPGSMYIRHWEDGHVLGRVAIRDLETEYGAPYIVVHRAVLHDILHRHAVKSGATVKVYSKVVDYDFNSGSLELSTGEKMQADLIVATDGINSFARKRLLKDADRGAQKTGWAAYRMMADIEKIKSSPEIADLVARHNSNLWIGENRSAMTYMVYESKMLNMIMSHRNDVDTSDWTTERYSNEVKALFRGWDPRLVALIDMARPNIQNWPVFEVTPLPRWTSESGRFVLMGDAAHAMAFYLSMGISLVVEDAVALTECLSLATYHDTEAVESNLSLENLKAALSLFEVVRKQRAEAVQKASLHAGDVLHMPPGAAQKARDAAMKADEIGSVEVHGDVVGRNFMYGIADRKTRDWCYGYDAIEEVRRAWKLRLSIRSSTEV